MSNIEGFDGTPGLRAQLEEIITTDPSLRGRLETGEQLKELQRRFAESMAVRGIDPERVSQSAFDELHPGHTRRV